MAWPFCCAPETHFMVICRQHFLSAWNRTKWEQFQRLQSRSTAGQLPSLEQVTCLLEAFVLFSVLLAENEQ